MSEIIKLSDVSVIRNKVKILDNINWSVNPGENWAVIGRNGAGKSFLLNVIAGNIFPSQGKVTVLDRTFGETDMLELRRLIGYVSPAFQYNYDGATSVNKVVYSGFFASNGLYYDPTPQMIDQTADILRRMGLSHLADKPFGLLSSGEQKKVLIARAMVFSPKLLILDEVCTGLDIASREEVLSFIEGLSHNISLIFVTHYIEEIMPSITNVLYLRGGKTFAAGTKTEMISSDYLSTVLDLRSVVHINDSGRYWLEVQ